MIFVFLLFFTAIALSSVAAYYSIAGLIAIFPATVVPIAIMGVTLEVAKLVSASWLYRNWNISDSLMKYYFTTAVVILSVITSMGIFGFLSKAHIEQTTVGSQSIVELKVIEDEIQSIKKRIENNQRQLNTLDSLVEKSDTEDAIRLKAKQAAERKKLTDDILAANQAIKTLNQEALPLRKESKKLIAEVGPIKFIADLLYQDSSSETLEKAVRIVIILLVIVFDPLAIVLLIAANKELKTFKHKDEFVPDENLTLDLSKVNLSEKKKDTNKIHEIPPEILDKVFKGDKSKKK